jgi:hypothetical protein
MTENEINPNLKDYLISAAKAVASAIPIPFIGTAVGEIIGTIIPNQRIDRIAIFIKPIKETLVELSILQHLGSIRSRRIRAVPVIVTLNSWQSA